MARFRAQRGGGLTASMATLVELLDRAALLAHLRTLGVLTFDEAAVRVQPYYGVPDTRIGWDVTYIVTVPGYGVVGFTDGPL